MSSNSVHVARADEPYVYVIYTDANLDEGSVLVTELAHRGIPISPDDIYDPDVMDLDDAEAGGLLLADAVLIVWSAGGGFDADVAAKIGSPDILVLASLDGSLSARFPLRTYPTVDLSGWSGEPDDPRLDELAAALRDALRRSQLRRRDHAEVTADREPRDPDYGLALSDSARMVLTRAEVARGTAPNASTVLLLTALAHNPGRTGVGDVLLGSLERRQGRSVEDLVGRLTPWLKENAVFAGLMPDPRFMGLLALAEQCAWQASGKPEIHLRHLLAAAVLARQETAHTPPVDASVLTDLGTSAEELPGLLLAAVRETSQEDSLEAWESLLAVRLAGGYDRDLVDPNDAISREQDDLEHAVWAAIFAAVIADEATPLPVSIGLFGEWGAGKSTFMGLLRSEIKALCGKHGYVQDVVQIGFNAWHYADTNLWASLGDEIFRAMLKALTPSDNAPSTVQEQAKKLRDEIEGGLVAAQELDVRREAAKRESKQLTEEIRNARECQRVTARELVSAVLSTLEVRSQLTTAWRRLGIKDEVTQGELLADELDGIRRQVTSVRALLGQRLTWILAGTCLLALLVALLGTVIPRGWAVWLRGSGAIGTVTLLLGSAAALTRRVKSGIDALRSAANRAATAANEKSGRAVKAAQDKLRQAEARERAAEAELRQVSTRVEELKREHDELAPGKRLYSFLAERAASADYGSQLGLVSTIRKDFQHLVRVLDEHRHSDTHATGAKRVDRIILYIDDLDRCQPRQVVEVLQAVHLLLALDLFVVVVGVDPRWLVRSLREQYPGILGDGPRRSVAQNAAGDAVLTPGNGGLNEAVPADYLQKIFNIPFTLPAFRRDDMRHLIRRLADRPARSAAQPTAAEPGSPGDANSAGTTRRAGNAPADEPRTDRQSREAPAATEGPDGSGTTTADATATPSPHAAVSTGSGSPAPISDLQDGDASATAPRTGIAGTSGTAGPSAPETVVTTQENTRQAGAAQGKTTTGEMPSVTVPPHRLTEDEILFLGKLGPFVRTPRDAKRLFNVYRMLRTTGSITPTSTFLSGEYQATAMLLAILTLDPQLYARMVDAPRLEHGADGGLARRAESESWATFARGLNLKPPRGSGAWRNAIVGEIPATELAAWQRMWAAVEATHHDVTLRDLTAFQAWAPRVRRFSFLVLTQSD